MSNVKFVWIKWGRGKRRIRVKVNEYEKVGKIGRLNLYKKKKKTKKVKVKKGKTEKRKTRKSLYFTNRKKYFEQKRETGRKIVKRRIEKPKQESIKQKGKITRREQPQKIDKVFEKKISKVVIRDFLNVPTNEVNLQYRSLLKQVMNKKSLGDLASDDVLDAMIKQENINKIKWRFEIRADVYDRDGTKVLQMIKGSNGDLMSLRENMKKGIWRGASVDYDIDCGDGYVFKLLNKGNIDRVEVTIIFRS